MPKPSTQSLLAWAKRHRIRYETWDGDVAVWDINGPDGWKTFTRPTLYSALLAAKKYMEGKG